MSKSIRSTTVLYLDYEDNSLNNENTCKDQYLL